MLDGFVVIFYIKIGIVANFIDRTAVDEALKRQYRLFVLCVFFVFVFWIKLMQRPATAVTSHCECAIILTLRLGYSMRLFVHTFVRI